MAKAHPFFFLGIWVGVGHEPLTADGQIAHGLGDVIEAERSAGLAQDTGERAEWEAAVLHDGGDQRRRGAASRLNALTRPVESAEHRLEVGRILGEIDDHRLLRLAFILFDL